MNGYSPDLPDDTETIPEHLQKPLNPTPPPKQANPWRSLRDDSYTPKILRLVHSPNFGMKKEPGMAIESCHRKNCHRFGDYGLF